MTAQRSPADEPFFRAHAALERGALDEAHALLAPALAADPEHPGGTTVAGLLASRRGDLPRAIAWLERAARLAPDRAQIRLRLGEALAAAGLDGEARGAFEAALALDPQDADAWFDLGFTHLREGGTRAAIEANRTVIRLDPLRTSAYNHAGVALLGAGDAALARDVLAFGAGLLTAPDAQAVLARFAGLRLDEAAAAALTGRLGESPDAVRCLMNLGLAQSALDDDEAALAALAEAVRRAPETAVVHYNLANVLKNLCRFDAADAHYARALELQPDYPDAALNRGCVRLHCGDYATGWPLFEARTHLAAYANWRRPASPLWRGEALAGRTLLLLCEQGAGDTLQFMRFIPALAAREGARVIVHAPTALRRALVATEGVKIVVGAGDALPPHDFHLPLMSLAHRLGVTLDRLADHPPRLFVNGAARTHWARRLAALDAAAGGPPRFRVGLAWAGNPGQQNDRHRSIPLALLEPLVAAITAAGGRAYSLQKHAGQAAPLPPDLHDLMDGVDDYADTAAIVEPLDLVVSVCTSVAHAAASLGRPTWVLLAATSDWRWLSEREDSPWYPSARLFRQRVRGDWSELVGRVVAALPALAASTKEAA